MARRLLAGCHVHLVVQRGYRKAGQLRWLWKPGNLLWEHASPVHRRLQSSCFVVSSLAHPQARFNFPAAGYLADEALCAVLAPLGSFSELSDLIKRELLPPPTFRAEHRQAVTAGKARGRAGKSGLCLKAREMQPLGARSIVLSLVVPTDPPGLASCVHNSSRSPCHEL